VWSAGGGKLQVFTACNSSGLPAKLLRGGNERFGDGDVCHVDTSYCNAINMMCRRCLIIVVNKLSFLFNTKCIVCVV
jgi:hypothetical protein